MSIETRLTRQLGLLHPVISAPMAFAAGGGLAAAVSNAGGLGLIGGGYGDRAWLEAQFRAAGNARVGCGFITWSLKRQPDLLDLVLDRKPVAVFLSFDDPAPFARRIKDAGVLLICQVQTRRDAERALDCGAHIVVAQGSEAGGHGQTRATLTLVPEVADLLATRSPGTLLCAAGGIADGRGLAASLMLGADGVVVGSRFWASTEALVHATMHAAVVAADGDATVRSSVMDVVRRLDWPSRFTARILKNTFTDRYHGREGELAADIDNEAERWQRAQDSGDASVAATFVGEAAGLIHGIERAEAILRSLIEHAEGLLAAAPRLVQAGHGG